MRIFEYIHQGGPIMYILLALNIIGFTIMISKLIIFKQEQKRVDGLAQQLADKIKTDLLTKEGGSVSDQATIIEIARQEISLEVNDMEKGLNTVKVIASISPLLGLLGTVIGVLMAFRVMSETGLNNPSYFAEGISMALITTVGGLIVAIPHYVGHNYLIGTLDRLELIIEKKILAKIL